MSSNHGLSTLMPLCCLALGHIFASPLLAQSSETGCQSFNSTSETGQGAWPTSAFKSDLPSSSLDSKSAKGDRQYGFGKGMLVSDLIRKSIYSSDGKRVGTINDIVLSNDFNGEVAIVGVGGFLGIGGKDIAIPKNSLVVSSAPDGSQEIQISSTWEQLEAAPAYDRTALMR